MAPITLYDTLRINILPQPEFYLKSNVQLPHDNTLKRAYELFVKMSNMNIGVEIYLDKRIPMGSGLGGGSSNGATLLSYLNKKLEYPLNSRAILKIAGMIGMDVRFFLFRRPAFMVGRGDILKKFVKLPKLKLIVVFPGIYSSTKVIYKKYDELGCVISEGVDIPEELDFDDLKNIVRNDLEEVFLTLFPQCDSVRKALYDLGAQVVAMTGSGSSFFGIFKEYPPLGEIEKQLKNWDFYLVNTET